MAGSIGSVDNPARTVPTFPGQMKLILAILGKRNPEVD